MSSQSMHYVSLKELCAKSTLIVLGTYRKTETKDLEIDANSKTSTPLYQFTVREALTPHEKSYDGASIEVFDADRLDLAQIPPEARNARSGVSMVYADGIWPPKAGENYILFLKKDPRFGSIWAFTCSSCLESTKKKSKILETLKATR